MGARASKISFATLGTTHMQAFVLYKRAKSEKDAQDVVKFLQDNVDTCVKEINNRAPGASCLLASRFQASMRAELLLLHDRKTALDELQSCHKTMVRVLNCMYGKKDMWQQLWNNQLTTMVNFVDFDTTETAQKCVDAGCALGMALDTVSQTPVCSDKLSCVLGE
jgi:hypothetical protein